jgi:hypothetical protein
MANVELKISASSEKVVSTAGGAGAGATATIAAAVGTKSYAIMAIISSEGTTPAIGRATLAWTKDGVAQTLGIRFAAAAFAPIVINFGSHPVEGDPNTAIVLTVPALSAAIQEAALVYYQRPE